jgi:hypothetical protein
LSAHQQNDKPEESGEVRFVFSLYIDGVGYGFSNKTGKFFPDPHFGKKRVKSLQAQQRMNSFW